MNRPGSGGGVDLTERCNQASAEEVSVRSAHLDETPLDEQGHDDAVRALLDDLITT